MSLLSPPPRNQYLKFYDMDFAETIPSSSQTVSTECAGWHTKDSEYFNSYATQEEHIMDVGQPDIQYLNSEFERLVRASDWENAEALFKEHRKDIKLSTAMGYVGETVLHFAAYDNQVKFVGELVKEMSEEDIAIGTHSGHTAFYYAVLFGHTEAARIILKKTPDQIGALVDAIYCDCYDIAKEILSKYPRLATRADKIGDTALYAFAGKVSEAGDRLCKAGVELMRTLLLKAEGDVDLMKAPLFKAAKQGNYEFLRIALNLYPRLTNELKDGNQTVLEVACHHYPDLLNKIGVISPLEKKTMKKQQQREKKSCNEHGSNSRASSGGAAKKSSHKSAKHKPPSLEALSKVHAVSEKKTAKEFHKQSNDVAPAPQLVLPSTPPIEFSHDLARCEMPSTTSKHEETMATNNEVLSKSWEKKKIATRLCITTSVSVAEPREKPPSLETLAIQNAGLHMEQLLQVLDLKAVSIFPLNNKLAFLAICRRKDLLNDYVLNLFSDEFIEILDISDSDVSDVGLKKIALKCQNLRALDISGCSKITKSSVAPLIKNCKKLKTLRWGGSPESDRNACSCVPLLERRLITVDKDSWEDIDFDERYDGATIQWLIWPGIGEDMSSKLAIGHPSVVVNPVPILGAEPAPREALAAALDEIYVKDIDAKVWARELESDSSSSG